MKRNNLGTYAPAYRRRGWPASIDGLGLLAAILLAPFRLLAAIWRVGVRTAFGFFDGLFYGFMGLFGLGMIVMVVFALYRVVLYPFFHHL